MRHTRLLLWAVRRMLREEVFSVATTERRLPPPVRPGVSRHGNYGESVNRVVIAYRFRNVNKGNAN